MTNKLSSMQLLALLAQLPPVDESDIPDLSNFALPTDGPKPEPSPTGRTQVLVVGDSPSTRAAVRALSSQRGVDVVTAIGAQVHAEIERKLPDLTEAELAFIEAPQEIDHARLEGRALADFERMGGPFGLMDAVPTHFSRYPTADFSKLSPAEKHARATHGQKPRTDRPPCEMCGLHFTFERPGCVDYAGRLVHTWCERRKPTKAREELIAFLRDRLFDEGRYFYGEHDAAKRLEKCRSYAEEVVEDMPEHKVVLMNKSDRGAWQRAVAKRARKAEARLKQREGKKG